MGRGEHRRGEPVAHHRHERRHRRGTGCSVLPKEVPRPSRRWAARRFVTIVNWSELAQGCHFAAWEQPQIFAEDLRATFPAAKA